MESLLRISAHLAVLISLDGFAAENDALRGTGSYRQASANLDELLRLKREGCFRGEVSVHCLVHAANIPRLYELLEHFETRGVNTVYFCFPWTISADTAGRMDGYFLRHFGWLRPLDLAAPRSWQSYAYGLPPEQLPALSEQVRRLSERVWHVRIRYQPALELDELAPFVLGAEHPAQGRRLCLAVSQRMNVLPDGAVTACKLFPEFTVGDLHREDVADLWHKPEFRRVREILHQGLTPACSRCVLLYLHGI